MTNISTQIALFVSLCISILFALTFTKQAEMIIPRYLVVVGGSYVGVNTAQQLAAAFHGQYRVLLIENNSHFQHLFAFPRFAVTTDVDTHKAFIPYTPGAFASSPPGSGKVVQARVTSLNRDSVQLDRKVELDGLDVDTIPFAYLVLATGTKLTPPSSLPGTEKLDGVTYLRKHAEQVQNSSRIVVIGGGAVGVQMATDIAEIYPEKSVTIVHSRSILMHKFHPKFHEIIEERCKELGVSMKLGSRVKLPLQGYPTDGSTFIVELENGSSIPADFAVIIYSSQKHSSVANVSPVRLSAQAKHRNQIS